MLPKIHIIIGAGLSIILYLIFPQINLLAALIIFLSSVLIDVDHYFWYIWKTKDWSLRRAHKWFIKKQKVLSAISLSKRGEYIFDILIFHGVECGAILFLLIFVNKLFLFVLIGFFIHIILDLIDFYYRKITLIYKISQIYVYCRNKNKKELNLSVK